MSLRIHNDMLQGITQGTQSRNSISYSGQIKCPVAGDGVNMDKNRAYATEDVE